MPTRSRPRVLRRFAARGAGLTGLAAALVAAGGCSGHHTAGPDAGALNSLTVLDPPGESIGLPFQGKVTLRVAYRDPGGRPIIHTPVQFTLLTSASESAGGATISASSATTDSLGIATIDLVAGAEQVNFRVQATADQAPPALFYLAVSEIGFTDLTALPAHLGFRPTAELGTVEVRLFRSGELQCADLDIDAPPASVFPPRTLAGFSDTAAYRNLPAGQGFTLIGWASLTPDGTRLAQGCAEIDPAVVLPGRAIQVPLQLTDRAPAMPPALAVSSVFDASPLEARARPAGGPDPWRVLACPYGPAQLLIDCALDAQASDGALDCDVNGQSALVTAAEAQRDPVAADGCRPLAGQNGSLDATLTAALAGPWPTSGAALDALLTARRAPLTAFALTSQLQAGGVGEVRHVLDQLSVSAGGLTYSIDVVDSQRPVVSALVADPIDAQSGRITLARHGLTLRYGRFARDAFATLGLEPAGLTARADDLGSALYDSVHDGAAQGCTAFSQVVCAALSRTATCLDAPCTTASGQLDGRLGAWWRALDAGGLDLEVTGSADVVDDDADLVLERLDGGAWTADLSLASGTAQLEGTWTAALDTGGGGTAP